MRGMRLVLKIALLLAVIVSLCAFGFLYYQGQQAPRKNSPYVALGSSFAAGLGLGPRAAGSPFISQRTMQGYPSQLARMAGLSLTDMSSSGATMKHVLHGGQMFLGPQIDAIGPETRLVTLTAGGNDIGYVGDLTAMAFRNRGGVTGFLTGLFLSGAKSVEGRNFTQLQVDMIAALREILRRAPKARILVVPYPAILPAGGTCAQIGIDDAQAALMRSVAFRLTEVTRAAAKEAGAEIVDLDELSQRHNACSAQPWVNGSAPPTGAPFHPTQAGAQAVADQIMIILKAERSKT